MKYIYLNCLPTFEGFKRNYVFMLFILMLHIFVIGISLTVYLSCNLQLMQTFSAAAASE